ncbi:MAG: hypothetical protein H7Z16_19530 [Pyrinomonadaceae bacterium]|nr:hypothetical protein [Pyrinomonadaceae bacterium]
MAKETPQAKADRLEAALVEVYGIANEAESSRQAMTIALDEITVAIEAAVPDASEQWAEQSTAAPEDDDNEDDEDDDE